MILSVEEISPALVREANGLSRALTRAVPSITGVFLFEDASDGRYYLGAGTAPSPHVFRKLFGARELSVTIAGIRFAFHPLAFSQVNAEGAGILVRTAEELLRPSKDQRLLDLYCGYGLFGLSLAPLVRQVTGIESSPHSVTAAIAIARSRGVRHARFFRDGVSAESLSRHAGAPGPLDLVVLDPPRGGTENGVIEAVAERRPVRVLHIFCNTEVIARRAGTLEGERLRGLRRCPRGHVPGNGGGGDHDPPGKARIAAETPRRRESRTRFSAPLQLRGRS